MNLQSRVTNILTKPQQEWPVIASESTDVAALYKEYIIPLSAIPAVCGFLGMTMVGVTVPFMGRIRTPIVSGITGLVIGFVLSLLGTYLAAFIIDKLAPSFQSSGGIVQALKMVAFASTPSWVAGVLQLVPMLGALALLAGLYGIYLCYLGLPTVMKTPRDKIIPYMVVSAIVIIVISFVMASISGLFIGGSRLMS
ncbi:MAG: YIP1 family protein [Acidobacteria bacterium]|nr:YIP1 family protein [Acidobacteriota bacterium]MCI0623812.1 YIP1 family protein [Acidobacteriota bacterium]MCI0717379.1 YIP1 family protein [Acidobacteriota bacterium]